MVTKFNMYIDKFNKFLELVNLKAYREKYRPIKLVEMDLPKEIQAIEMLYKVYWDKKKFGSNFCAVYHFFGYSHVVRIDFKTYVRLP